MFKKKNNVPKNVVYNNVELNRDERIAIGKRRQKKDIILNLDNKYKNYESEVVFKFYEKFKNEDIKPKMTKEEKAFERKMKRQNKARTFSVKALTTQINGYGFSYSFKDFFTMLLVAFAALIGAGIFYGIELNGVLVLMLFSIFFLPQIISAQFKYIYEQKRFSDVVDYLEYMIYEFKKKPKIILALKAAESSCTGEMKKRIKKAIDYIENGVYREDLYKEAFYFIEDGYECEHIGVLHKFLMKVEAEGGEYQGALNIILSDVKAWTERTYAFQKDKENIKQKMLITIGLSLVMCAMLSITNKKVADITGNTVYQIVTTGIVVAFMFLYKVVINKLSGSWLEKSRISRKRMFYNYALAIAGDVKELRRKNKNNILVFLLCGAVLFFFFPQYKTIALVLFAMAGFFWMKPAQDIKQARKIIVKEINREFPIWLRDLAINLQKETVHVSIKNSLKEAPLVLKPALIGLIKELDDDPVTIKPYANFLSTFELPDISSAMKMLYSLNAVGREEVVSQINTLVARNNELLEKSERMRNADSISVTGFLVALPMVISMLKMIVDMGLVLITFLTTTIA